MKVKTLDKFQEFLKSHISIRKRVALRRYFTSVAAFFFRRNLRMLAWIYGTDKWGSHWYAEHYQNHLHKFRNKKIVLLEIGVGGHSKPHEGGRSLRMWRSYFRKGMIYGVDIYDKSPHDSRRIKTFKGDEIDPVFLKKVISEIGAPDIIIDDGSHITDHNIKTFEILFPYLSENGVYIVEDLHTSYWPEFGGTSEDLENSNTAINYFKGLVDGLNHQEYLKPGYTPTYTDKHIVALSFYHNLVVINKGENNELSNRE